MLSLIIRNHYKTWKQIAWILEQAKGGCGAACGGNAGAKKEGGQKGQDGGHGKEKQAEKPAQGKKWSYESIDPV